MQKAIFLLILIFSTLSFMPQDFSLQSVVETLKEKYAPDSRVEIFNIELIIGDDPNQVNGSKKGGDKIILNGETTSNQAYEELLIQAEKIYSNVEDNIRLLPDKELGDACWGVIYNSVGTLRAEPRYASEMVSQCLLGTPVRVLENRGGWRRIQTPDKYIGWMNGSVKVMTKPELQEYLRKPMIIVTSLSTHSLEKPSNSAMPVSDLVAGNMLVTKGAKGEYYHILYPDGREAYVHQSDVLEIAEWLKDTVLTGESIVKTSYQYVGIPYLWGGTSSKGLDCSGFTKMVYFMHGIILSRDASQQVMSGKLIDSNGDFSNALPGDLVFFGSKSTDENSKERVVHVGIYIGNNRFIHASDYIHIGSFDPADPLYDAYNTNRYLRTKRIIGEEHTAGIDHIFNNELYLK